MTFPVSTAKRTGKDIGNTAIGLADLVASGEAGLAPSPTTTRQSDELRTGHALASLARMTDDRSSTLNRVGAVISP